MIIEELRMCAFGPYAKYQRIRFDKYRGRVFLISGDIGAGKTTIFDAICFALFDKACGSLREENMGTLRNQNAKPNDESYVQLVFTVDNGGSRQRYFVSRSPSEFSGITQTDEEKTRAKRGSKSSSATIYENPWVDVGKASTIVLRQEAEDKWTVVASGKQNVKNVIPSIIGFDADNFRQISMLAQGEFDRFLNEDTEERRGTLRPIFDTKIYQDYETVLKSWKNRLARDKKALDASVSKTGRELGIEGEYKIENAGELAAEIEKIRGERTAARDSIDEKLTELSRRQLDNEKARTEVIRANKDIEEWESARLALEKLCAEKEQADSLEKELSVWKEAEKVRPEYSAWERLVSGRQVAERSLTKARADAAAAAEEETAALEAKRSADSRGAERESLISELSELKKLLPKVQEVQQINREIISLSGQEKQAREAVADRQSRKTSKKEELGRCVESIERSRELSARLEAAQGNLGTLLKSRSGAESLLVSLKELGRLSGELESLRAETAQAEEKAENADVNYRTVLMKYHHDAALAIAKDLKIGSECPVCHKMITEEPDHDSLTNVTEWSAVEAAQKKLGEAAQERDIFREKLGKKEAEHKSVNSACAEKYSAVIGGEMPESGAESQAADVIGRLSGEITAAKSQVDECSRARSALDELTKRKSALDEEISALEAEIGELGEKIQQLSRETASRTALMQEKSRDIGARTEKDIREEILAKESAAAGIEESRRKADERYTSAVNRSSAAKSSLGEKIEQCRKLAEDIAAAEAVLTEKLAQKGFADIAELKGSFRDERVIAQASERVSRWHSDYSNAVTVERERAGKISGSREKRKLDDFDARNAEIIRMTKELKTQRDGYVTGISACEDCMRSVSENIAKYSVIKRKAEIIQSIAGAVDDREAEKPADSKSRRDSKEPNEKLSLEIYVQMRKFQQVLGYANKYLEKMSQGRYELSLSAVSNGQTVTSGLNLYVLDKVRIKKAVWRPVGSLSGGERFVASFALALGFSEYAVSRCAGHSSEMLFVDEGLSSLDPDSAKIAADVISDLSRQDRTIGIVSHVDAMKQRFSANRIEVRKTRDEGSVISTYVDGLLSEDGDN